MSDTTLRAEADRLAADIATQFDADFLAVFEAERAALRSSGAPARAVSVGDSLPAVTLLTSAGEPTSIAEALDGRTTVIVFYRGAWCPWCNLAITYYQRHLLPQLRTRGIGLVAVSPQTPDVNEQLTADAGLEFPVLSDPGNALAGDLGIVTAPAPAALTAQRSVGLDVAAGNADGTVAMPHPTVLIVDGTGNVRFADVHVDYTTRTEVADVLRAVDAAV